jgi:acyl-CoA reductase-like NAD-dependent aldehyde dehydrogenase
MASTAKPFLVNGQWVKTSSFESVHSPYSGDLLATVCQAEPEHIDLAIETMEQAARELGSVPGHSRARALARMADGIICSCEGLAAALSFPPCKCPQ